MALLKGSIGKMVNGTSEDVADEEFRDGFSAHEVFALQGGVTYNDYILLPGAGGAWLAERRHAP